MVVTSNLNQLMNRLLIILILISQVAFAQSKIQHEPERIFNKLITGQATTEFAKEKNLKKVTFYRDTVLSSSMEFDRNGNFITTIGMENKAVQKHLALLGNGILEHRAAIKWDQIKSEKIVIPPINEQKSILEYIDIQSERIDNLIYEKEKDIQV